MVQIGELLDKMYTLEGSDGGHNTQTLQDMPAEVKVLPPEELPTGNTTNTFNTRAVAFNYAQPQPDNIQPVAPKPNQDMSLA